MVSSQKEKPACALSAAPPCWGQTLNYNLGSIEAEVFHVVFRDIWGLLYCGV